MEQMSVFLGTPPQSDHQVLLRTETQGRMRKEAWEAGMKELEAYSRYERIQIGRSRICTGNCMKSATSQMGKEEEYTLTAGMKLMIIGPRSRT